MKKKGGFLISQISRLQARVFERMLKESGIDAFNGAQGRILYVLWEYGKLSITEISRLTSLSKTTLTSMLDRMEGSGLVKRIPDPENRRQIHIVITEKARACRDEYQRISGQMNEVFYQGFAEDEVAEFEKKLTEIMRNLERQAGI
jgi:DNA-binding MarR family transcriptional regulator